MKLLKSILLTTVLFASPAFAQSVATVPTPPSPPAIVATSPNQAEADAVAQTNRVYINQAGSNVNINVQQTGQTNTVGTLSDPVYLRGDNQTVTVIQTGNSNSVLASVVSDTGALGLATVTLRQIGNSNSAVVRCGNGTNEASCNNLNMNALFTGDSNSYVFHGAAANITNTVNVTGSNNTLNMDVTSPNASQTVVYNGSYNTVNATQSDIGGMYGHSLYENVTGSNNNVTTQQYGPNSTIINLTSVGSNGTINIKTGK